MVQQIVNVINPENDITEQPRFGDTDSLVVTAKGLGRLRAAGWFYDSDCPDGRLCDELKDTIGCKLNGDYSKESIPITNYCSFAPKILAVEFRDPHNMNDIFYKFRAKGISPNAVVDFNAEQKATFEREGKDPKNYCRFFSAGVLFDYQDAMTIRNGKPNSADSITNFMPEGIKRSALTKGSAACEIMTLSQSSIVRDILSKVWGGRNPLTEDWRITVPLVVSKNA